MTQKIRRRIEALENVQPLNSIWAAVDLTDDEILDRALKRLSDEDLELLLHLSDDSHASQFPTEREGAALHAFGCALEREHGCLKPSSRRKFAH
jgi:hypothetical protein